MYSTESSKTSNFSVIIKSVFSLIKLVISNFAHPFSFEEKHELNVIIRIKNLKVFICLVTFSFFVIVANVWYKSSSGLKRTNFGVAIYLIKQKKV